MALNLTVPNGFGQGPQRIGDQDGGQSGCSIAPDSSRVLADFRGNGVFSGLDIYSTRNPPGAVVIRLRRGIGNLRWEARHLGNGTFDIVHYDQNNVSISPITIDPAGAVTLSTVPVLSGSDMVVDESGNVGRQSSSVRFKEDVEPFQEDFEKALHLEAKSFTLKGSGKRAFGYLAEDVEEIGLEDLVGYDGEGRPDTVHYKQLGIYAIELLKEQKSLIEEQGGKIAELESAIERLEAAEHREPRSS